MKKISFFDGVFSPQTVFFVRRVALSISAIGLVISGAAFATSWETSSIRAPGGGLIRIGMTRQEVLKELGPPPRERSSTQKTASSGKFGRKSSSLTYRGDDGLYTISFTGEKVVKIVVTPKRD
jgi:hypothetical protein